MERLILGIVGGGVTELGLAAAVRRRPDLVARPIDPNETPSEDVAGLILDAPLVERGRLLGRLIEGPRVPILVETPFVATADDARGMAGLLEGTPIFSANPLRYALHTRRLLEEVVRGGDPPQSFFAAWRLRPGGNWEQALPQILDYLGALCGGEPVHISTMRREAPPIALVSLRYANEVIGSLELGQQLPETFPADSELVVECFCRESVYHCMPGYQAITVEGSVHRSVDWRPDPADQIVGAFVELLRRGGPPLRGVADDLGLLLLREQVWASR